MRIPMSTPQKEKRNRAAAHKADEPLAAAAVTPADQVVLEIRKFIAAAIFFNTQAAEKAGLGLTDMQVMHMLQIYGPSTPSRLAAWTGLSSGGVTVALDRLERAGYIKREPNPTDRRSLLITLVPARVRKLEALYQDIESETRQALTTISERDLEAALRVFLALAEVRGGRDQLPNR